MNLRYLLLMASLLALSRAFKSFIGMRPLRSSTQVFQQGHGAPANAPEFTPEEEKLVTAFREHQQAAPKISIAESIRTLIDQSNGYGTLSTNSVEYEGYPTGSVVGFQLDDDGMPFMVFSSMSAHTKDVLKDGRVSLTILAEDFKGAAEGRVILVGDMRKNFDKEKQVKLREKYLEKHKEAFWIDFGDFTYFTFTELKAIRFVGGFAMAGAVTPEEYFAAKPDPLAPFAKHVIGHMNDDHSDATQKIVKKAIGIPVSDAQIVGMDRLGMTVKAKLEIGQGGYSKVRVPFPYEVTERSKVKEVIVALTEGAADA